MGIIEIHQHFEVGSVDQIIDRLFNALPFGKTSSKKEIETIKSILAKYLESFYEKNRTITTIVFDGVPKELETLYVPIVIRESGDNSKKINMNKYECLSIFEYYNKIMVVDTAGMGKSTLVKYLCLNLYEKIGNMNKIPVVIELRKLKNVNNIEESLMNELSLCSQTFPAEKIKELLDEGAFIIFFDGYDELEELKKNEFADTICELSNKANGNHYFITSRDENSLVGFAGFHRFKIDPLTKEKAYELIRKYDGENGLAQQLIDELNSDFRMSGIHDFLTNPLLTSLLYAAYRHRNIIPNKKHLFYEQVYDALFQSHDLTKGGGFVRPKKSGLDKEAFQKVLNRFGFLCVSQNKILMSREELCELIKKSLVALPTGAAIVEDFICDLLRAVPLIIKDGVIFQWVHKSFAEYFAACFICKDSMKTVEMMRKIVYGNSFDKYKNVFDFCYDMDSVTVREFLIKETLEDYISYYNETYKDAYFDRFSEELLQYRKAIGFMLDVRIVDVIYDTKSHLKEYEEKIGTLNGNKWSLITTIGGQNYSTIFYNKKYKNFIELLSQQGVDIFIEEPEKFYDEDTKYLQNAHEANKDFVFNDNADEICNQDGVFQESNDVVLDILENKILLDYKKCCDLLSIIINEIQSKKDDIFDI